MNTIYKPKHLQSEKRTLTPSTDTKNTTEPATDDEKILQQKISEQRCVVLRNAMPTHVNNNEKYSLEFALSGDMIELYFKGDRNKLLQILPNICSMQNVSQNGSLSLLTEHRTDTQTAIVYENKEVVMEYAMRFQKILFESKKERWKIMWDKLLENETMKTTFFSVGRQKFSANEIPFNRNGVANVVGFLKNHYPKLFAEQRNTEIALIVEGNKRHSIRQQLGGNNLSKSNIECVKKIYNEIFK